VESALLEPHVVGSNPTFKFREMIEATHEADSRPFMLKEGELLRWTQRLKLLLAQKGLWLECVDPRPPSAGHPLFAIPLSEWDRKAAAAAVLIKQYVDPNLLARIPAERWEDYQSRRGLERSFLRDAHRMLPRQIRNAAIWSPHQPLVLAPKFGQAGSDTSRSNTASFTQAEHDRRVEKQATSGYYLLEQLKRFAKPFRLVDLPPELRLIIYQWILASSEPINVLDVKKGEQFTYRPPPPLTEASPEVGRQTLPIYYVLNRFELVLKTNRPEVTKTDGWKAELVRKWYHKIGDLYHRADNTLRYFAPYGSKIAGPDIVSKMSSLAVTVQVRVLHRNIQMVPPSYQMVRFHAEVTASDGLIAYTPTSLTQGTPGRFPSRQRLEEWLMSVRSYKEEGRCREQALLEYFFGDPALWKDWRKDRSNSTSWNGGRLLVWCDCH